MICRTDSPAHKRSGNGTDPIGDDLGDSRCTAHIQGSEKSCRREMDLALFPKDAGPQKRLFCIAPDCVWEARYQEMLETSFISRSPNFEGQCPLLENMAQGQSQGQLRPVTLLGKTHGTNLYPSRVELLCPLQSGESLEEGTQHFINSFSHPLQRHASLMFNKIISSVRHSSRSSPSWLWALQYAFNSFCE